MDRDVRPQPAQIFDELLELLPESIAVYDREARFLYVNETTERMFGRPSGELLGNVVWELYPDAVGNPFYHAFQRVLAGGPPERFDHYYAPWDAIFENHIYPMSFGLCVVAWDITERRRAEQRREEAEERLRDMAISERAARSEAERANRLKDEFLATLSHELRTPLNAIVGWAQMLQRGHLDEASSGRAVEVIDRNARLLTQLVSDLLDMSRIISGKLRLDVQPVDPRAVVEAAVESVQPAADAKAITLVRRVEGDIGTVMADASRLQQVAWNLLSNAIKFTQGGGRVEVRLARGDGLLEIAVSDTGQGIPPEFLPYLFDRFRQADAAITRQHGGLGLGLSICRHLVELHGGTVHAKSAGEGQGATFTVKLPLAASRRIPDKAAPASPSREPPVEPFGRASLGALRVLVVDDEPDALELVQRVLEEHGAEVVTAASAVEALDRIARRVPDVLVSDIGMPEVDGYDLVRRLRALPPEQGGEVPALALTAFARPEDRARAIAAGYDTHLKKPFDGTELCAAVARLAASRGRRD